jgi:hypothetical protein
VEARLSAVETGLVAARRERAGLAEIDARQQPALDSLSNRLDCGERRLELSDS